MDFRARCLTSRDNPDSRDGSCFKPQVSHGKYRAVNRTREREPSFFSVAMLQIRHCKQKRIAKDGTRKIERHAVLAHIRSSFDVVPLELKVELMQSPLSRIPASRMLC